MRLGTTQRCPSTTPLPPLEPSPTPERVFRVSRVNVHIRLCRSVVLSLLPVKRHRGEPGHTRAHGHTDEPHNHPNPPTHPSDRETTESAADSTAAAPEPTAPRGRLGGRPLRTRPSRPPLHRGEIPTGTSAVSKTSQVKWPSPTPFPRPPRLAAGAHSIGLI